MDFNYEKDRIYAANEEGQVIAEVTFPISEGVAKINRTFVDGSLRGQGVAAQLLSAATERIRGENLKAKAVCSYAVKWFEEHPEERDLLE